MGTGTILITTTTVETGLPPCRTICPGVIMVTEHQPTIDHQLLTEQQQIMLVITGRQPVITGHQPLIEQRLIPGPRLIIM